ncbi:hexitol phosphatase HxpB [Lacibacter sediminis]|uniref:Hexitol phosphatase HxpB n=1 Tax=Lacibacter sediminis TaxID=2760713 RepID=A0A7G5XKZ7_9BACT|nr:hexitol phosphatase HxpB [Lacibacter sediminis]QNA46150.1 hexitol phosphatase HxpB [Lacibacter sediminis]
MKLKAVIFDMDGLLIDSEPLWQEAGSETLAEFGKELTLEQYHTSTGLRTEEWIQHWFHYFDVPMEHAAAAIDTIISKAISKIDEKGIAFPGVDHIIPFVKAHSLKVGLATSSPLSLVDVVLKKLHLQNSFDAITSAEKLPFGKPHPEVYLNCAAELGVAGMDCIAFEDSFNGMIAAKAARMKCVIVPAVADYEHPKWNAADLKLGSLTEFDEQKLQLFL